MADTMTLEQVRDWLRAEAKTTNLVAVEARFNLFADAIDAAIRERDRLRGDVSGMTEELLHVPSREEWRTLQKRADRAEAELAALKERMKPCAQVIGGEVRALMDPDDEGKYVAVLVVEE